MVTTAARRNASAQAPYFPPSEAAAASRLSSRAGWGCCLIQFQNRGISNCSGKPEFCQRGRNSSRSDLRLLRSSDRPLGTAKFRSSGTVWECSIFSPMPSGNWMARRTFPGFGGKRGGKNHADASADYCIEALLRNGADGRFGLQ